MGLCTPEKLISLQWWSSSIPNGMWNIKQDVVCRCFVLMIKFQFLITLKQKTRKMTLKVWTRTFCWFGFSKVSCKTYTWRKMVPKQYNKLTALHPGTSYLCFLSKSSWSWHHKRLKKLFEGAYKRAVNPCNLYIHYWLFFMHSTLPTWLIHMHRLHMFWCSHIISSEWYLSPSRTIFSSSYILVLSQYFFWMVFITK